MSPSRPFRSSSRACTVIGVQHEALLRLIGGNICNYCSKRGSVGCAWQIAATGATRSPPAPAPPARLPNPAPRRGPPPCHSGAEVASHLGP